MWWWWWWWWFSLFVALVVAAAGTEIEVGTVEVPMLEDHEPIEARQKLRLRWKLAGGEVIEGGLEDDDVLEDRLILARVEGPIAAASPAILSVGHSPRFFLLWWYYFDNKVRYAASRRLAHYVFLGGLPPEIQEIPAACWRVKETNLKRRTRHAISNHHSKIIAILATLDAGVETVVYVDVDAAFRDTSIDLAALVAGIDGALIMPETSNATFRANWQLCSCVVVARRQSRDILEEWLRRRCGFKDQFSLWDVVLRTYSRENCAVYPFPDGSTIFDVPYDALLSPKDRRTLPAVAAVDQTRAASFDDECRKTSRVQVLPRPPGTGEGDPSFFFFGYQPDCDRAACLLVHVGTVDKKHLGLLTKQRRAGSTAWYVAQLKLLRGALTVRVKLSSDTFSFKRDFRTPWRRRTRGDAWWQEKYGKWQDTDDVNLKKRIVYKRRRRRRTTRRPQLPSSSSS